MIVRKYLSLIMLLGLLAGGVWAPPPALADPSTAETLQQKRQALKQELMNLPPEQRKARIAQLKQQAMQNRAQTLQQKQSEFQARWDKATPQERTKFCARVNEKCNDSGKAFACGIAKTKCAGP